MQRRAPNNRQGGSVFRSPIMALMLSMFATMATFYVANRLWQDAETAAYLIKQLRSSSRQDQSVLSVEDAMKLATCREQTKKLSAAEMELAAARKEGFMKQNKNYVKDGKKKLLAVVGIMTSFGRKNERDVIRATWMKSGEASRKLEVEKGILTRFVVGSSANPGDSLDKDIDTENNQNNDFFILDGQTEGPEEGPNKTKSFFIRAVEKWDADFYIKVNDYVYVDIDALGALLATHLDKLHVYMGCMKSGQVISDSTKKWYEPDWWKFGDEKSYFQYASGDLYVISRALAQFISVNRYMLRTYAHDDVSASSWFIGLDVNYIKENKFCCYRSPEAICATVQ